MYFKVLDYELVGNNSRRINITIRFPNLVIYKVKRLNVSPIISLLIDPLYILAFLIRKSYSLNFDFKET